ncbi:Fibronectin type III domain protein [Ignavibacterium album JCM 16511]|uniref:Fibronectin type III domain protein n=1 Tax=Ignavibacterium album (strain DSM 19864 / JCM 16511 / NBRC 101810 / Mat9-16) TaxID=945713 RepID=I0AKB5_IGNAJ|nr:choice-of-anchor J domain-containing protein [Ignavibacterium album]AFH49422.1 Fibronectin type III domain protein [Ignavibacterium album JCM 16511]
MKRLLIFFLMFLFARTLLIAQNDHLTQEQKLYLDQFGNPTVAENIPLRTNGIIKWSEGFEDVTFPPSGWNVYNVDGGTQLWIRNLTTPIFGSASASIRWESSTLTNDDWLVTPQFLVDAGDTLKFWAKMQSTSYTDSCQIFYSTTGGTPPTGYNYITTIVPATTPALFEVDLSALAGQNVFIAFRYNALDQWRLYLDSVYVENSIIPVELTSFVANVSGNSVKLIWKTATETNNQGFEVQRSNGGEFKAITFINGKGTTTETQTYSYVDNGLQAGKYSYRLKQIDLDGQSEFSSVVEVEILSPKEFNLAQNYPNPFNPSTEISFSLTTDSKVTLKIFNILGQEVATLINGNYPAGNHKIKFDGSSLNSGVYMYRLDATGIDGKAFSSVKKMILNK